MCELDRAGFYRRGILLYFLVQRGAPLQRDVR
jgi:hypothetical protein